MSNRAQITQQAARDGVPAPTVERDYILAHIIAGLASLDNDHGLDNGRPLRLGALSSGAHGPADFRLDGRKRRRPNRRGPA